MSQSIFIGISRDFFPCSRSCPTLELISVLHRRLPLSLPLGRAASSDRNAERRPSVRSAEISPRSLTNLSVFLSFVYVYVLRLLVTLSMSFVMSLFYVYVLFCICLLSMSVCLGLCLRLCPFERCCRRGSFDIDFFSFVDLETERSER